MSPLRHEYPWAKITAWASPTSNNLHDESVVSVHLLNLLFKVLVHKILYESIERLPVQLQLETRLVGRNEVDEPEQTGLLIPKGDFRVCVSVNHPPRRFFSGLYM